jgi:nitroimidazol reductase NimA-like FMN-containing flavoprotein (pyridoxamine 5'-phosphate oxidase superfamily)
MSVRLSADESLARIASAHTGIVTTLRRDGVAVSTPVWFVVHDGAVHFGTPSRSKKASRLRGDPRIGFLVEGGERWAELWAVHLAGRAVPVDDDAVLEAVAAAQAVKYAGFSTPRSEYPEATRRFYERDTQRITYRIDAEVRVLSWDNAKLGLA